LLSNNRVNELIGLPLRVYAEAQEREHEERCGGEVKVKRQWKDSAEMNELATHFISFLKTLAMRMTTETLQFFLSYPTAGEEEEEVFTSETNVDVKFPLYARALEFCGADQDSFVRVTAMNICLNTLRLATVPTTSAESSSGLENFSTPDTSLSEVDLPQRERLAIAHHVCSPSRVQELVSPIFSRLAQICGDLEEAIKHLDGDALEKENEAVRRKHKSCIRDVVGTLQDELMLLDDVLKVGLISLNEQTIEMMLATFIYPLLLQPLLLYAQRHPRHYTDESGFSNGNGVETKEFLKDQGGTASHPFSVDSVSNSLLRSGLLGGEEEDPEENPEEDPPNHPSSSSTHHAPDASPAKTALFALASVFNSISNRHLLRLLFASLLHPLAPDASGAIVMTAKPNVVRVSRDHMSIRIDHLAQDHYGFGKEEESNGYGSKDANDDCERCVFVLAPTLAYILEGGVAEDADKKVELKMRPNPYRRVILACLAGADGMIHLQKIAVCAFNAAILAMRGRGLHDVLFGKKVDNCAQRSLNETEKEMLRNANAMCQTAFGNGNNLFQDNIPIFNNNNVDTKFVSLTHVVEVVASLCVSVVSSTACVNGIWRLDYDTIAAHALIGVISQDEFAKDTATNLIELRRRQSATFVAQLPSLLDTSGVENLKGNPFDGPKTIVDDQDEDHLDLLMDQIVRDSFDDSSGSVVDALKLIKTQEPKIKISKSLIKIAEKSSTQILSSLISSPSQMLFFTSEDKNKTLQCAASSSIANFQLDALATLIRKGLTPQKPNQSNSALQHPQHAPQDQYNLPNTLNDVEFDHAGNLLSCLSRTFTSALFVDKPQTNLFSPHPGAIVTLVGKTAFPCVCEVSEKYSSFFTDESACVVADGVKWQSLYLVLLNRYMILAEPDKGGSDGNGRIVTFCLLSNLHCKKDKLQSDNTSTARRLLLHHFSTDPVAPDVFTPQVKKPPDDSRNTHRSRMDLWFEDNPSVNRAFDLISSRITKARSTRGKRLRQALLRKSL